MISIIPPLRMFDLKTKTIILDLLYKNLHNTTHLYKLKNFYNKLVLKYSILILL